MLIQKTCRYIAKKTIQNIKPDENNLDEETIYKRLSILSIYNIRYAA